MSVSPELEKLLLDFAVDVILKEPKDLISHAVDYFERLRGNNKSNEGSRSQKKIARKLGERRFRRGAITEDMRDDPGKDEGAKIKTSTKTDMQREKIMDRVKDIFVFRILNDEDREAVIDAMIPSTVKTGDIVFRQGDDGDQFYLVDRGSFHVIEVDGEGKENRIDTYDHTGFFGMQALLHNQPRAATVKAASNGMLWVIRRETFNKIRVKSAKERLQIYENCITNTPPLNCLLHEDEKNKVLDAFSTKFYERGETIVHEGELVDGMYFVIEGKVLVTKESENGKAKGIDKITEGQHFGGMNPIEPQAKSYVAFESTKVAFLDKKAFERLLGPFADMERDDEN